MSTRERFIFWSIVIGLSLFAIFGCNGVDPCELSKLSCLATCETECISLDGCFYTCKEPDPPPPPDPCEGVTCECGECVDGICPECPPPPVEDCPFNTPTISWMIDNGYNCEVFPKLEGRKAWGATPRCDSWPDLPDGTSYYCQEGLWPERCADGRRFGPVAPDGHPKREVCEAQFMEQICPTFSYVSDTHMSADPWVVIDGVNQNHPRNVRVCKQGQFETHESWKKDPGGYIKEGMWSWATWHGNGKVCASGKDGKARRCVNYLEP